MTGIIFNSDVLSCCEWLFILYHYLNLGSNKAGLTRGVTDTIIKKDYDLLKVIFL